MQNRYSRNKVREDSIEGTRYRVEKEVSRYEVQRLL